MLLRSSFADKIANWPGTKDVWQEAGFSGLGDFDWNQAIQAVGALGTTALQVYNTSQQIDAQKTLAARGVYPSGYQNGIPIYSSSPLPPVGVTPSIAPGIYNPYTGQVIPQQVGYTLPMGVTQQQPAYTYIASGPSALAQIQPYIPAIAIGGGALLLILLLRR